MIGLRADFLDRSAEYPELVPTLQGGLVLVGPMDQAELRAAIERPAASAGLIVDEDLVEMLLADLGLPTRPVNALDSPWSPGEMAVPAAGSGQASPAGGSYEAGRLPLLAYALQQTWQHREGRRLTVTAYRAAGGIDEALARAAEAVYETFDADGRQAARRLLLRLVKPGKDTPVIRRRVTVTELIGTTEQGGPADTPQAATARAVLTDLVHARLLTADADTIEISHDALLSAWPRLRQWLDEDRVNQLIHYELTDSAHNWDLRGRDPSYLFRGTRLAAVWEWAASHGEDLNPIERAFLTASQQHERRTIRLRRTAAQLPGTIVLERPTVIRITQSGRRTEMIGDDVRSFNNAKSSSTAVETLRVSHTARVSTSVDLSKTRTLSGSAGVSFVDMANARASLSNELTRHYSLQMDSELTQEQTTQINIPANTNVEVTFRWFLIWVTGMLTLADLGKPDAEIAEVPFEITVGLSFNKETRDIE